MEDEHIFIIKRHKIRYMYILGKFACFMSIALILGIINYLYKNTIDGLGDNMYPSILTALVIIIINISFILLIIDIIRYFNNLIIITANNIIIIQNSIYFKEDIEVIDISKITKINVVCRGFICNLLGYGKIILEQQRSETRGLFYIKKPYEVMDRIRNRLQ